MLCLPDPFSPPTHKKMRGYQFATILLFTRQMLVPSEKAGLKFILPNAYNSPRFPAIHGILIVINLAKKHNNQIV